MLSSIPFLMVPSAPITMGITYVFIFYILCISISRSLYLLFFSISLIETFLSHDTVMSINLQVEFTLSLIMISGLFAPICLSVCTAMSHSTGCVSVLITVSGWCSYHLFEVLIPKSFFYKYCSVHMLQLCCVFRCNLTLLILHILMLCGQLFQTACNTSCICYQFLGLLCVFDNFACIELGLALLSVIPLFLL